MDAPYYSQWWETGKMQDVLIVRCPKKPVIYGKRISALVWHDNVTRESEAASETGCLSRAKAR